MNPGQSNQNNIERLQPVLNQEQTQSKANQVSVGFFDSVNNDEFKDILLKLFQEENRDQNSEMIKRIAQLKDPGMIDLLISLLSDPFQTTKFRCCAIYIVGELKDKRATISLLNLLTEDDSNIQKQVIKALGSIGDISAIDPLLNLLIDGEQETEVRMEAAKALGKLGNASTISQLERLQDSESEGVCWLNSGLYEISEAISIIKKRLS